MLWHRLQPRKLILAKKKRKRKKQKQNQKKQPNRKESPERKKLDLSQCLLFYFICAVVLILLFFLILVFFFSVCSDFVFWFYIVFFCRTLYYLCSWTHKPNDYHLLISIEAPTGAPFFDSDSWQAETQPTSSSTCDLCARRAKADAAHEISRTSGNGSDRPKYNTLFSVSQDIAGIASVEPNWNIQCTTRV